MSRLSRTLHIAYGALLVWLAYCAVMAARAGSPWACVAFIAGAGLCVTAAIREGDLEDALRREAVLAERQARPHPSKRAEASPAAWCCDAWAATAGADHEPACPNYQHRSAA